MSEIEKSVTEIETLAPRVAAEYAEQAAAVAEERAAREALLARVLEIAKPALRAVCSRVRIARTTRWHGNVTTSDDDVVSKRRYLALGVGPGRDGARENPHDNAGPVTGWDLYLRDDGAILSGKWSGHWTRWQGAGSSDWLNLEEDPREVEDDEPQGSRDGYGAERTLAHIVAKGYDERVIEALAAALTQQAGSRDAEAPRERAAKIAAVAALLGGGK